MELVKVSTLAEMAAAAEYISGTEIYWLQDSLNPKRVVCWLAPWLRVCAGVSRAKATAQAGVDVKTFRTKEHSGIFPPWRGEQLPLMARVLRDALRLRRDAKWVEQDSEADEAATALPEKGRAEAFPKVMRAKPGVEVVREAAFEEAGELGAWEQSARFAGGPLRHAAHATSPAFGEGGLFPSWEEVAHAAQLPPVGEWRTWMLMGGRGAGKTRAGAEWVRGLVEGGLAKRIALVGPSLHDVREVMIAGPSGLTAIGDPALRPTYEVTRRRLVWPDKGLCKGAVAYAFSAEDPDSLRGPQFDAAWCDEIGAWANDVRTWKTLAFAMRLGAAPRIVATTTPRPRELVKMLFAKAEAKRGGVVLTQASTRVNAENLAPEFVAALEEDYGGTELGRQEIDGALVEDREGALWTRAMIEATRASAQDAEGLERVVVAVDPPVTATGRSDACGIVVAGVKDGVVYVLADATVRGLRPKAWAERVAGAAEAYGAHVVVAEGNQGGELVRDVLMTAGEGRLRVRMETATRSKKERAQPVSLLYEQGRVRHVRVFKELEDEMCSFGADVAEKRSRSPDRVDALVWAVMELRRKRAMPSADLV